MSALKAALDLHQAGALDAAEAGYQSILSNDPDYAEALGLRGVIALQRGDPAASLALLDQAISIRPDLDRLHGHRTVVLCALDRLPEALTAIELAEAHGMDRLHCLAVRANILCDLARYAEGIALYEQILEIDSDQPRIRLNLGMALWRHGDLDAAETALLQARHDPSLQVESSFGLGLISRSRNDLIEANLQQRTATALDPNFAPAQLELGELDLLAGFYGSGFAGYEWRHHLAHAAGLLPRLTAPIWDGTSLTGKSLFVYIEQGYGDAIQFARFLSVAAQRGARITLGVSQPLAALFQSLPDVTHLVTEWSEAGPFEAHAPIGSLPLILGVDRVDAIPSAPYLAADPSKVANFRARIGAAGFRVGLAWSGRPAHPNDAHRSLPADQLLPLASCGARLISLQKDATPPPALNCLDLAPDLHDFADTAAAIMALDLVITVDTAIAHLAGALGKPVWVLLPFAPDWRWRLDVGDSPWYPTARLFRQPAPGDWESVIAAVSTQLSSLTQRT